MTIPKYTNLINIKNVFLSELIHSSYTNEQGKLYLFSETPLHHQAHYVICS